MRNIIVGTAGHIDHGKTALVRALTGIDADRLAEEKRRGITIDLGFAHLPLAKDLRIGFIDVPGHERFVRNMLAGAAGIDAVLFVVSAEESIKPQTREHFEICRMLGVQSGVVAITKADLVDPDLVDLVRLEFEDFAAGSFLENAPKIPVSSVTGAGIPQLRKALETVARNVREKSAAGWFRLPIDRSFTMKGFGSVVTGTLVSGVLRREQEVELYPAGRRLRVRGLQVYGESADRARAGERTAVNLPDIEPSEISRGMVLGEAGCFAPVTAFDCRLDLLASARPLKNGAPVHLHTGAAEIEAEVRLLNRAPTLKPGATAWARVVLREPALLLPGDRFIIRMFSPVMTIGGGVVAALGARKYRRGEDIDARLAALSEGRLEPLIAEHRDGIAEAELIALTGLRALPAAPLVGKWFLAPERASALRNSLLAAVRQFHKDQSLLSGIPKQDLKGRVAPNLPAEIFEYLMAAVPELAAEGEAVRLRSHKVVLKVDEEQARASIEAAFAKAGLPAPGVAEVLKSSGIEAARARSILQILLRERRLIRISEDLVLHETAVKALRQLLANRKGQRFAVPQFKDWTGVSRKYAIPILEYLDREHITRREADERFIV
jgi:selenocysteine-specific elongation factor